MTIAVIYAWKTQWNPSKLCNEDATHCYAHQTFRLISLFQLKNLPFNLANPLAQNLIGYLKVISSFHCNLLSPSMQERGQALSVNADAYWLLQAVDRTWKPRLGQMR